MPLADHGGFEVVAEIPEATALAAARRLALNSPATPFASAQVSGSVSVKALVTSVAFIDPDRLALDIDISGTRVDVTRVAVLGTPMDVAPWMQRIDPRGTIKVNAPLTMTARHALVVNLAPSGNDPLISFELVEDSILSSPLVTVVLAQAIALDPTNDALYRQARDRLLAQFRTAIESQVRQTSSGLGAVTLAPAPTLPSSASGAANTVAISAFRILPRSIKLCYQTASSGGAAGSPAAIMNSNLVRSAATNVPVDAMSIDLSNAFVLRNLIRDGLTVPPPGGPGIPLSAFSASHPLWMQGPLLTTVPGPPMPLISSLTYNLIAGGIDGTNIRLLINVAANGAYGAFRVTANIDAAFSVTAGAGSPPSIVVAMVGTPAVSSDLTIAWWVHVGILLGLGITAAGITQAAEGFVESFLNGTLASMIAGLAGAAAGTFTAPLDSTLPPLSVRSPVSLGQTNATVRIFTVTPAGTGVPIPLLDPFRDNDLILTLV